MNEAEYQKIITVSPYLNLLRRTIEEVKREREKKNANLSLPELGRDDGFRPGTYSRINVNPGKGAINIAASYPLNRLADPNPNLNLSLYLFGQAFAGYGENLLDDNRWTTRLRVGIGIIR